MNKSRLITILVLVVSFILLPAGVCFAQTSDVPENPADVSLLLLEQKRKYEKEQVDYIQKNILDKVLGTGKASVVVSVEFALNTKRQASEARESTAERKRKMADVEYLMPGIPNPKAVSQSGTPPGESKVESGETRATQFTTKLEIQKQAVTVIHDDRVIQPKLVMITQAIKDALGFKEKRDSLVLRSARFTSGITDTLQDIVFKPSFLLPLIITFLLLTFLFGPFSSFLRNYVTTLRDRAGTEVNIDSKMENPAGSPAGAPGAAGVAGLTETEIARKEEEEKKKKEEEEKYMPFSFVDAENLRRIIYLISKETAANIATVLSYLKPEFVREVLVSLPEGLQSEVALELAQAREVSKDEVLSLDSEIKQKIDFLVGGLDRLLKVLEEIDRTTRDNILAYLRNEKPDLYDRLRKHIFLFEDIVEIPDITLQSILRELKVENIARALRNADEKLVTKFFTNMSTGAVSLVKEEMEFGRTITPSQVEEERSKIVETIKKLEADGKIFIREKPKFVVEGLSDETRSSSAPAGAGGQAGEYFSYGAGLYNEGKYDEAVQYLEYCVQLNPEHTQAYQFLGNAYYSLGNYNGALSNFEKALQYNPQDAELKSFVEQLRASLVNA